jgi:hypothetical protein
MSTMTHRLLGAALVAVSVCVALGLPPNARANAPDCRYVDNGDTVLDTKTNLEWRKAPLPGFGTQGAAATACAGLVGGYRMPTVLELSTLVDVTRNPTIDEIFDNGANTTSWTGTQAGGGVTFYLVEFADGSIITSNFTMANVRCVKQ